MLGGDAGAAEPGQAWAPTAIGASRRLYGDDGESRDRFRALVLGRQFQVLKTPFKRRLESVERPSVSTGRKAFQSSPTRHPPPPPHAGFFISGTRTRTA